MQIPTIANVTCRRREAQGETDKPHLIVETTWNGVDRTDGLGIALPDTPAGKSLAVRLMRAIRAGVVFTNPTARHDISGKTYASSGYAVWGRTLNADLRRLGY
jgi:hypothetical protein